MSVSRDRQYSEWAKLVHDELLAIEAEGLKNSWNKLDVYRKQREALARRTYDLAMFIVSQAFEDELVPEDILYKNGKPVLMYPENLAEWYKKAPFLASYDGLPDEVKAWVEQDLGWKRDEVTGIHIKNEILPDGFEERDGEKWVKRKLGKHVNVTIERGHEAKSQTFIRGDDGWKVAHEVKG